ncbi:hypothetical protein LY76DRAFT_380834 [Colletotrichum caudatum]|nr:hypothetical protein LY76DRAFT_380834 [Colletotrichum caudatum]
MAPAGHDQTRMLRWAKEKKRGGGGEILTASRRHWYNTEERWEKRQKGNPYRREHCKQRQWTTGLACTLFYPSMYVHRNSSSIIRNRYTERGAPMRCWR